MNRLAAAIAILLLLVSGAMAAKPKVGDVIADAEVKGQLKPAEAAYLGLPEGAAGFRLTQIKAEALVVEIFSMYCPRCQAEAPAVNRIFERLKASAQGKKLKYLAIGAGNSAFEVDYFRKKYQSPYPMAQDAEYNLHKLFGAVGTPSYFVLKPAGGGKGFKVLFFQEGPFEDENAFLQQLLTVSGVK